MITNERQYRITKAQLAKIKVSVDNFNLQETSQRLNSVLLAKADLDGLRSEIDVLEDQVHEYEALRSGSVITNQANTLAELHTILIKARIANRLSQRELAEMIGLKEQQIQRYESQKYAGASLRRILEIAKVLKVDSNNIKDIEASESNILKWEKFPVKTMYKRGWFEEFSGSLDDIKQVANELVENYISSYISKPSIVFHRKSFHQGTQIDPYALLAWECRILALAQKDISIKVYKSELLTSEWLNQLRKLSSHPDGIIQAKAMLEEFGILLIIEPHLPNTLLDGAALLLNGKTPVIGMTLRYDRKDNFWFVLFHELMHILKHLKKGNLEELFDNDLEENAINKIELEADNMAGDALISPSEWEHALPRFVQSKETIELFASQIRISPAIVAGRIRRETKNFRVFSDLVGQREVRKYFSEISFGD